MFRLFWNGGSSCRKDIQWMKYKYARCMASFHQSSWIPTAQYVGSPIITQFCLECARRLLLPVLHHLPVITSSSGELLWWSYLWIQHWSCFWSDPSFDWVHPVRPISARSCLSVPGRMFGGDCNAVGTVHLHYSGVCHDWISYRCLDFQEVGNEDCE